MVFRARLRTDYLQVAVYQWYNLESDSPIQPISRRYNWSEVQAMQLQISDALLFHSPQQELTNPKQLIQSCGYLKICLIKYLGWEIHKFGLNLLFCVFQRQSLFFSLDCFSSIYFFFQGNNVKLLPIQSKIYLQIAAGNPIRISWYNHTAAVAGFPDVYRQLINMEILIMIHLYITILL